MFGEFEYDPTHQYSAITVEEQLEALGKAVASGKVGIMYLRLGLVNLFL